MNKAKGITQPINCEKIQEAIGSVTLDLSNQILYDMCLRYPSHKSDDEIVAKILIIGRVYSAAIERRKNAEDDSDTFYKNIVARKIRENDIDKWFIPLFNFEKPTRENCAQIISIHKRLTNLFEKISGLEKRSLASKYLHFHFPNLFFIYDSISANALKRVESSSKDWLRDFEEYDNDYADFFLRCLTFTERVNNQCARYLTPRELDKYLLFIK